MKKFFKKNWKFLASIFGLFLVIVAVLAWVEYKSLNPAYYAKIGSKKITSKELNEEIYGRYLKGSIEKPDPITLEQKRLILTDLIESEIAFQKAQTLGITVSDKETEDYIRKNSQKVKNEADEDVSVFEYYTAEQKEAAKKSALKKIYIEKVKEKLIGWKEGEYLLFRFDKFVDYGVADFKLEGLGDKKLIEEQKKYADELSKSVSQKLQSGTMTFEEARTTLTSDSKISAKAFDPVRPNVMGEITKLEFTENLSYFNESIYQGLKAGLADVKKGSYSNPILLKGLAKNEFVDFAYAVVKVTDESDAENLSYNQWLSDESKRLGAEINLPNSVLKNMWESVKNFFAKVANAASATCWSSYSGSHRTNLSLAIMEQTASGQSYKGNVNVTVSAGSSSKGNGLIRYNSSCSGGWYAYSMDRSDDDGSFSLQDNDGASYAPALINCGVTSAATIKFPSLGKGHWEIDLTSNAAYDDWVKSFNTGSDGSATLALDLGTDTNWANGLNVLKKVVWEADPVIASYKFRPAVSYFVNGNETNVAKAGDVVTVAMWVFNEDSKTIPDVWVRDNINNNGVNNTVGVGSVTNPYSIRALTGGTSTNDTNRVCTSTCGFQGAGNYGDPTYDKLQWASHSVEHWKTNRLIVGDQYEVQFSFKVPAGYTGKYVSTRIGAMASEYANFATASAQTLSNLAMLRIVDERNLTVGIDPAGTGNVTGGLGGNGTSIDCPGECSENFDYGKQTSITANDLVGSTYTFSYWSGCPTPNIYNRRLDLTMNNNYTCIAHYVRPAAPAVSCDITEDTDNDNIINAESPITITTLANNFQAGGTLNWVFNGGTPGNRSTTSTTVTNTYTTANTYNISVSGPDAYGDTRTASCGTVRLNSPTSGGVNEVSP